jgi:peptide maturation system protein (TIGR04066 family)
MHFFSFFQKHATQTITAEQKDFSWIKKACVFPYNKEMHALVRARELLSFELCVIVDPIGKGLVGKDAGECIGIGKNGLTIKSKLEDALPEVDTLILGHINELGRAFNKNLFRDLIEQALLAGKNVFHLDPVKDTREYSQLLALARERQLVLQTPAVEDLSRLYKDYIPNMELDVPVVGVFGTSAQQGKFTAQLALRKELLREGYSVVQIGTEPHCELFGFDLAFPIGYEALIQWPEREIIRYLHYKMAALARDKKPDIMVVGSQSGISPYDVNTPATYTLSSLAFLLGTRPDAYLLAVNTIDTDDYIQDSLNTLKALGQGKTILFLLSDKEKQLRTVYGRPVMETRQLTLTGLEKHFERLEKRFGIPATEVVSEQGRKKLLDTVINYFRKD